MKLETTIELLNGETPLVRLEAIEVFDDGSGAHGLLTVTSGHFACRSFPFYFDDLERFCRDLPGLYRDLRGKTRLSHTYEHDFVEIEMGGQGHVTIRGEIAESGGQAQRLVFSSVVDQSYLPSMVRSAEAAMKEMKAANQALHPIRSQLRRLLKGEH